jgi:hypothetical protein
MQDKPMQGVWGGPHSLEAYARTAGAICAHYRARSRCAARTASAADKQTELEDQAAAAVPTQAPQIRQSLTARHQSVRVPRGDQPLNTGYHRDKTLLD